MSTGAVRAVAKNEAVTLEDHFAPTGVVEHGVGLATGFTLEPDVVAPANNARLSDNTIARPLIALRNIGHNSVSCAGVDSHTVSRTGRGASLSPEGITVDETAGPSFVIHGNTLRSDAEIVATLPDESTPC